MAVRIPEATYELEQPARRRLAFPIAGPLALGLILLVAALIRFVRLDSVPLSPDEATEALAVWVLWHPGSATLGASSPAYYAVTSPLTAAIGFSDASMRLAPAVFGLLTVGLPWFLRHRLGHVGALVFSALLAVSPLYAVTARTAGGQAIALFCGLLLFTSWLRYQEAGARAWLAWFFFALGLGLCSAPLFYNIALTLLIAWLAQAALRQQLSGARRQAMEMTIRRPSRSQLGLALLPGLAVFLLMNTAFFLNIGNFGAFGRTVADWISLFGFSAVPESRFASFSAILRYEPALLVLGIASSIWAIWRPRPFTTLPLLWLAAALIVNLLQPSQVQNLLLLTLPGYMLIGRFVNEVFGQSNRWSWAAAAAFLLLGAIFFANLVRVARFSAGQPQPVASYYIILVILAIIGALIVFSFLWTWDKNAANQGVVVALLVLVLVDVWGVGWWLTRDSANDTRESWVDNASDDELELLASTVQELSWRLTNSPTGLTILSSVNDPALRWYLRDMNALEFVSAVPRSTASQALITPAGTELALDTEYTGADFGYRRPDTPLSFNPDDFDARLRWWLFHEAPVPVNEERLVLWLRSDLVGETQ